MKASSSIHQLDIRAFKSFADYAGKKHYPVVVYLGATEKSIQGVRIQPWQSFLRDVGL